MTKKINNPSSRNLKENKKFDYFYNEWWDLNGPFKPLHNFNELRINFIKSQIFLGKVSPDKEFKGLKILDVGCGGGILSEPLAAMGGFVTGIDTSKKAISIAKSHSEQNKLKINYLCCELSDLNVLEKFDVIICMEVLEHIDNIDFFLECVLSRLKPNGVLIGSTINRTISSYVFAIHVAEKFLKLLPRGTHDWKKFIKPIELESKLLLSGFKNTFFKGSIFNPINENWYYNFSKNINYFFSARE
ncbi:MAG: bifunctional 3-demethylubiquinol 3-O-methyltransferase/2-polyprenyl-6-hydroxyphenol methylase [Rickettsiales bacterium]|nr:bifunctional 3-demethylubiquinol 3-O-methyltransferase/2-polyprenyl-6-hydroxyphenol methylase [Rickettsiales bacterium]OUV54254.1 MAG: hypothetical protein CBC87_02985 [Rickettsiales bacterium TMED127]|tara:strand:+ start:10502 stop:11236 length:735 start_codon:yes stop_codon:yes gene_type:complete